MSKVLNNFPLGLFQGKESLKKASFYWDAAEKLSWRDEIEEIWMWNVLAEFFLYENYIFIIKIIDLRSVGT